MQRTRRTRRALSFALCIFCDSRNDVGHICGTEENDSAVEPVIGSYVTALTPAGRGASPALSISLGWACRGVASPRRQRSGVFRAICRGRGRRTVFPCRQGSAMTAAEPFPRLGSRNRWEGAEPMATVHLIHGFL